MKYYLSLCAIIKNERYLEEFIIYYYIIGVEHFYIYDNESNPPLKERLNKPFFNNLCTIINFPGKIKQLQAYNNFINKYGDETEWAIVCDGDEYIVPKVDWSLRDFLNRYNDVQSIGINWVLYGSSFHNNIQDGFLIDKYRYCEGKQNEHIKIICKPRFVINWENPHYSNVKNPDLFVDSKKNIIKGPFNHNHTIDLIQINHYHYRSIDDIIEKYNRGNADSDRRIRIENDLSLRENSNHHKICNNVIDNFICDKYLNHIIEIYNKIYN